MALENKEMFLNLGADETEYIINTEKEEEILNSPFSHTRIKTFYDCRRKFLLKYYLGLLEDYTMYEINRRIGVNIHLWVGEFYKNKILFDSLEDFFYEKIDENDRCIYNEIIKNFYDFELMRRDNIYEKISKNSTDIDYYIYPLVCEEVLNDGVFAGYVDTLFLDFDRSLIAVDWKTSDSLPKPGYKNFPADEKRQLKIYARLASKLPGMKYREVYSGPESDKYILSDDVLNFLGIQREDKLSVSVVGDYYLQYGIFNCFCPDEKSYKRLESDLKNHVKEHIKKKHFKKYPQERKCLMCGYLIKYCTGEFNWYGI